MWIAKGALLSFWLIGFGTMGWLYASVYRHLPASPAVSAGVLSFHTLRNPIWWAGVVACLIVSFEVAHRWSGPLGVWIALAVTSLVPAGALALFITLFVKVKQASAS